MRYNSTAARILRELTHKDINNNYTDYDILGGSGPLATQAKIRFLEGILHERHEELDVRLSKIKEIYSLCSIDPPGNPVIWNLNEFRLQDIEFTLNHQQRFFGYSATIGQDMVAQTDRGTLAYPIQRGRGTCLDYVDLTNKQVVYSNVRENFCGTFENFQYEQDYKWFKNLFENIFNPEKK